MEIHRFSPSLLNRYDSCPLAFKYSFDELPEVEIDDSKAELGAELHRQIAFYLRALRNDITEEQIQGLSRQAFGEAIKGKDHKANIIRNFLSYDEQRRSQTKHIKPDLVEAKLYADLFPSFPQFVTIVDAYWRADETCIDRKTGSATELNDHAILQGTIESLVLKANDHPLQHHLFVYLGNNRTYETPMLSEGELKKQCLTLLDSIKVGHFPKKPSGLCRNYCKYVIRCEFEGVCLWQL